MVYSVESKKLQMISYNLGFTMVGNRNIMYLPSYVFVPNRTIATGFYNVPRCRHESTIANWGGIHDKLDRVYEETGLKFIIDSAFASGTYKFRIKSSQDDLTADEQLLDVADQIANIAVKRAATNMRQYAEWGTRAVQSSFPRLKDTIIYEEHGEKRITFNCLFHL